MNYMMVLYPSRGSIDAWAALGNEGWGYDDLAPYFRKSATVHVPSQKAKDVVGLTYHDESITGDGPVQVSYSDGYGRMNKAWMETFSKFDLDMTSDWRTGTVSGAFQQPSSIDPKTRTRSYAATAHYTEGIAKRPNLTVMTGTVMKKVLFDQTRSVPAATGVLIEQKDGSEKIILGRETVLAAGSLMTPQILELSGVGSKTLLDSHDIPVVVDNPSVGDQLQDHPVAGISFEVNDDVPSSDVLRDPAVLGALIEQFQTTGEGPLGGSDISVAYAPLCDAAGKCSLETVKTIFSANEEEVATPGGKVLRALLEAPGAPTVEYCLLSGQANIDEKEPTSLLDYIAPKRPENYLVVLAFLHHSFSRGSVHISSPDVHVKPSWDPGFGKSSVDLEILARHLEFIETLATTAPFSDLLKPGGARIPPNLKADNLENAKEVVRMTESAIFHPSCSCPMLPKDQGGVVDTRLRVYGVSGLRIVDASVFPLVPMGNIQTTVYAVAERAADLIKEDGRLAKEKKKVTAEKILGAQESQTKGMSKVKVGEKSKTGWWARVFLCFH